MVSTVTGEPLARATTPLTSCGMTGSLLSAPRLPHRGGATPYRSAIRIGRPRSPRESRRPPVEALMGPTRSAHRPFGALAALGALALALTGAVSTPPARAA